jgi:hypothetical protein
MNLGEQLAPYIIESILTNELKWVSQTEKAVKAAKAIIAQLRNSYTYFDSELVYH